MPVPTIPEFIEWIKQLDSDLEREYDSCRQNERGEFVYIDLQEAQVTDDDLLPLTQLKHLEHLNICANEITNEGLAHVADLTTLKYLDAGFNSITDDGLQHLQKLNCLESLVLNGTEDIGLLTDHGLLHLASLHQLAGLHLNSAQITDDSIQLLAQFSNLKILDIGGTLISDSGVTRLKESLVNCRIDIELGA